MYCTSIIIQKLIIGMPGMDYLFGRPPSLPGIIPNLRSAHGLQRTSTTWGTVNPSIRTLKQRRGRLSGTQAYARRIMGCTKILGIRLEPGLGTLASSNRWQFPVGKDQATRHVRIGLQLANDLTKATQLLWYQGEPHFLCKGSLEGSRAAPAVDELDLSLTDLQGALVPAMRYWS